jgi:hypothetical protein
MNLLQDIRNGSDENNAAPFSQIKGSYPNLKHLGGDISSSYHIQNKENLRKKDQKVVFVAFS